MDEDNNEWDTCLIDAPTQSGKTKACLKLLEDKIISHSNTLVIFITQANSTSSVDQIMQRASSLKCIVAKNIYKSSHLPRNSSKTANVMLVDFWNARNTKRILKFLQMSRNTWKEVIVIIDEADQGNLGGVRTRLTFLTQLEEIYVKKLIKVVFITATVANFSKQLYQINKDTDLCGSKLLTRILTSKNIEHHYANPCKTYIGASWYHETPGVWRPLVFSKQCKDIEDKNIIIFKNLKDLPTQNKKLTLMAVSNLIEYHNDIAPRIVTECGYNVAVKLNNANGKNYQVIYKDKCNKIFEWSIPFKELDMSASRGELGDMIKSKYDYTLSHVLQSTLFADKTSDNIIYDRHISFYKPKNFPKPESVKACLIAGNLASRGITIQNPHIGFICTSYCLTDLKDGTSRGASNTQRFGRACGMLLNRYGDSPPILIASESILRAAIANEISIKNVSTKTRVCIKDLIPAVEWKHLCENVKRRTTRIKDVIVKKVEGTDSIDGVSLSKLVGWISGSSESIISKMVRYLYKHDDVNDIHHMISSIEYKGTETEFQTNVDSGRSIKCNYGKLWCAKKGSIYMNPNIRCYLDSCDLKL